MHAYATTMHMIMVTNEAALKIQMKRENGISWEQFTRQSPCLSIERLEIDIKIRIIKQFFEK